MKQFKLPDPGEGLVEAEIVAWRVSVGDVVKVNDIILEIETSKSLVELPSPWAGTITEILVDEGTTVEVGTPIIVIDDGSGDEPEPAPEPAQAGAEDPGPMLVGYGPRARAGGRRKRHPSQNRADGAAANALLNESYDATNPVGRKADEVREMHVVDAEPVGDPLPEPGVAERGSALVLVGGDVGLAKPPVRKLAKDLGVDLSDVRGTGPDGRITRADVEAAAMLQQKLGFVQGDVSGPGTSSSQAGPHEYEQAYQQPFDAGFGGDSSHGRGQGGGERRVPIKGVRKITAQKMVDSFFTAVHVTEWVEVDITATMEMVETLRGRREFAGLRISPLLIYAKAICLALDRNPDLNTSWDESNQEIVYREDVNLGIAAATPRGLLVPNIKGANRMNLLQLCQAINNLVEVAKEGRTQPSDTSNGTFTITNVGVFGIDAGTPIINAGEAGILCMGAISRRPWVVGEGADERIEPRWVTTLSISFDHRMVDGEQGSKFLYDVATILTDPAMALLF